MTRGRFITVEGGEGAGKSTQIAHIVTFLRHQGLGVLATREPGGTPLAEEIRKLILAPREERVDPAAELLLIFAARAQHVRTVIEPALARGTWVVCDRFSDATLAYQGFGRGLDASGIRSVDRFATGGLQPDLTLLFDIAVERGLERAGARGAHDRFEEEKLDFHERVRAGYREIARSEPARVRVVDASHDAGTVSAKVSEVLQAFLGEDAARG